MDKNETALGEEWVLIRVSLSSSAPTGRRYTCKQIGSYAQVQVLLRQGHRYLDGDGDGQACESLKG